MRLLFAAGGRLRHAAAPGSTILTACGMVAQADWHSAEGQRPDCRRCERALEFRRATLQRAAACTMPDLREQGGKYDR